MELMRRSPETRAGVARGGARRGRVPGARPAADTALADLERRARATSWRTATCPCSTCPWISPPARLRHARDVRRREHDQPRAAAGRGRHERGRDRAAPRRRGRAARGALRHRSRGALGAHARRARRSASQALDTFTRILTRPEFPREVLEREKVRLIGALKEADTRPETIAARNFYRLVYRDHPYALRSSGEVATVAEDHARGPRGIPQAPLRRAARGRRADRRRLARGGRSASRSRSRANLPRVGGRGAAAAARAGPGRPGVPRHRASRLAGHILIGAPGITPRRSRLFPALRRQLRARRRRFRVAHHRGGAAEARPRLFRVQLLLPAARAGAVPDRHADAARAGAGRARGGAQDGARLRRARARPRRARRRRSRTSSAVFPLRIDSNAKIHEYLALIGVYRLPLTYLDDFVKNVER